MNFDVNPTGVGTVRLPRPRRIQRRNVAEYMAQRRGLPAEGTTSETCYLIE